MTIALGSDHGGFNLKNKIKDYLIKGGYEVIDEGTYSLDSCHYPLFAQKVAKDILNNKATYGVLVCTSGEGVSMSANRFKGIRCGLAYNDDVTYFIRLHNNANIISFGAKHTSEEEAIKRLNIFLSTKFEGGRHQTRVDMIDDID